ncbi:MAG: hypothetical protein JW779_14385 [Candidatus Thorarchaeota archaeon]|nr:hypothetical protein [Candidatus Thorarchaeota archaeon]
MPDDWEHFEIIRVIEDDSKKKLCAIRIFKNADSTPRPIIELPEMEQVYFPYEIIKCFDNVKDAHDFAEKQGITNIEY